MIQKIHPPLASSLVESLRDVGYTFESAIADVIDNCITAKASQVKIFFDIQNTEPIIAIIDNGVGMNYDEMLIAMKIGSKSPLDERESSDLGRFGLGLKTASFSQCRKLTVVSSQNSQRIGMSWDLDLIAKTNDWSLQILENIHINQLYKIDELSSNGTLVLWENTDRISDRTVSVKFEDEINSKINIVKNHLELVFHRFLDGEFSKVLIFINGEQLKSFDPFNKKNQATQLLVEETIEIDENSIKIQPFILPHHSKTTKKEYEQHQGDGGYLKNQGFYVYRNGRLLIHGTWFRLVPQKELYKLARVQIDLPNALDDLWKIDVKKSHASPPAIIRERLKKIIEKIVGTSTRVYIGKGHRESSATNAFWHKESARGGIKYSINKEHPYISEFVDDLPDYKKIEFKNLLDYIGDFFPLDLAITEYSQNPNDFEKVTLDDKVLEEVALQKINSLKGKLDLEDFADFFKTTEPTSKYKKDWKQFVEQYI
ncbi:MAG: ATP-binding protein [Sulfurimonas sp.]|jgi:hypothetical protein